MRRLFQTKSILIVLAILTILGFTTHADAAPKKLTLKIEGQGICKLPTLTDNQKTLASVPLLVPEKSGPVTGNGTYTINGSGYTLAGKIVVKGTVQNGILTIPHPDYYYNGKMMNKSPVAPVKLKAEAGSEADQNYANCTGKMTYRLEGPEEKWQVIYDGYQVLYNGDNRQAGGVKVFWRTTCEFTIENGKYKSGQGKNEIVKVGKYTHPPGVWDCVTLKGYPRISIPSYSMPGVKNGNTVRLTLPKQNNFFYMGYTCVMDTNALKSYYKAKGFKTFPSLKNINKTPTIKDDTAVFPSGFHDISLNEYSKEMEKDKFQGYRVTVKKLQ